MIAVPTLHAARAELDEPPGASVESVYEEAQSLMGKHKWAEAAIVLRSILKRSPEYSPAAVSLARSLCHVGRREEALSILGQAANGEKIGVRRTVLIRQARVLSRMFLTNAAFQAYQDGVNFLLAKKYRAARERFEKALTQEPDNIEILTRVGQCLVMDADYDSAAERLRLARKLSPFESEVHLWLGRALHQRGEINDALTELHAASTELDGSELAPVWYAEALSSAGQRNQAIQVLEEDLKTQPFHLLGLLTLARLRYLGASHDSQSLWNVRKDLQVALSRYEQYTSATLPRFEGELGLDLRAPEQVKLEIQALLQRVESRIAGQPGA